MGCWKAVHSLIKSGGMHLRNIVYSVEAPNTRSAVILDERYPPTKFAGSSALFSLDASGTGLDTSKVNARVNAAMLRSQRDHHRYHNGVNIRTSSAAFSMSTQRLFTTIRSHRGDAQMVPPTLASIGTVMQWEHLNNISAPEKVLGCAEIVQQHQDSKLEKIRDEEDRASKDAGMMFTFAPLTNGSSFEKQVHKMNFSLDVSGACANAMID
jgi:hypothetical protein